MIPRLTVALALLLAPALPALPAQEARPEGLSTRALIERFEQDRRSLESFYSIRQSPRRHERLAAFEAEWRARIGSGIFEALTTGEQVDLLLLRRELDLMAHERAVAAGRLAAVEALLPFRQAIIDLEESRWRLAEVEPREAASLLDDLAAEVRDVREVVHRADPAEEPAEAELRVSPVDARRAAQLVGELSRVLDDWYESYAAFHPDFAWWCEGPHGELDEALAGYRKHLQERIAGLEGEDDDPLVGESLGREALERAVELEGLAYDVDGLLAIGEAEFAWCEARLAEAAAELGLEDGMAAIEHVKELHADPGEQDMLVARQAQEAIDWLDERELLTIEELCRETWRLEMISERGQRTLPFAAYSRQSMLVAFPTQGMDHDTKLMSLRGNNEHFTRIVTPHELIPGHHLQGYMAQRYADHRSFARTPFLVEGWALYWEMLMWDEGWARGPEDRVGMLFWRMHRCARILVSLGFHLGEMTPEEMIDFLVERVGHERHTATAEVRRYVGDAYGPLYQCGYMIGGKQLRALAEEVIDSGRMDRREFHDAVLRLGPIPVELIRAELLGQRLSEEWSPGWEF